MLVEPHAIMAASVRRGVVSGTVSLEDQISHNGNSRAYLRLPFSFDNIRMLSRNVLLGQEDMVKWYLGHRDMMEAFLDGNMWQVGVEKECLNANAELVA